MSEDYLDCTPRVFSLKNCGLRCGKSKSRSVRKYRSLCNRQVNRIGAVLSNKK